MTDAGERRRTPLARMLDEPVTRARVTALDGCRSFEFF